MDKWKEDGETVNSTVYTVTAHNAIGGSVNASFDLSSIQCMEGKDLITIRVRSDRLPNENSWKVIEKLPPREEMVGVRIRVTR